jgi:hypothetical protein
MDDFEFYVMSQSFLHEAKLKYRSSLGIALKNCLSGGCRQAVVCRADRDLCRAAQNSRGEYGLSKGRRVRQMTK